MTRITLDAALSSRLYELGQVVELCDPTGKVLGRFVPAVDTSGWEPVTPELGEEELLQREQSGDWVTTDEVLARLQERGQS